MPVKKETPGVTSAIMRRNRPPLAWVGNGFLILLALLAAYILISNMVQSPIIFLQNVLDGLKLGFVYALIALGYTMVYGIVKLINFAHGDVFMVGAFTSFFAVSQFHLHQWPQMVFPGIPGGLSVVIGSITVIILSMVVCTLLAVTIERVAYKPLRDAPRIAALITAIGVSFFLEFFGALQFVFSPGSSPTRPPSTPPRGMFSKASIPSFRDRHLRTTRSAFPTSLSSSWRRPSSCSCFSSSSYGERRSASR